MCRTTVVLLVLAGCTAKWESVVKYSPELEEGGVGVEEGVYDAVIAELFASGLEDTVVLVPRSRMTSSPQYVVQGRWEDSLKIEATEAVQNVGTIPASFEMARRALVRRGILPLTEEQAPTRDPESLRYTTGLDYSGVGFNGDSSIAAIEIVVTCGPLCGHTATLLLARRPGYRWRVWKYRVHLVS